MTISLDLPAALVKLIEAFCPFGDHHLRTAHQCFLSFLLEVALPSDPFAFQSPHEGGAMGCATSKKPGVGVQKKILQVETVIETALRKKSDWTSLSSVCDANQRKRSAFKEVLYTNALVN